LGEVAFHKELTDSFDKVRNEALVEYELDPAQNKIAALRYCINWALRELVHFYENPQIEGWDFAQLYKATCHRHQAVRDYVLEFWKDANSVNPAAVRKIVTYHAERIHRFDSRQNVSMFFERLEDLKGETPIEQEYKNITLKNAPVDLLIKLCTSQNRTLRASARKQLIQEYLRDYGGVLSEMVEYTRTDYFIFTGQVPVAPYDFNELLRQFFWCVRLSDKFYGLALAFAEFKQMELQNQQS
jgi:hypothetical protein